MSPNVTTLMESSSRHQCLIYQGAPSRQLPAVASVLRQKLDENFRCLYLNSPPMVAGMGSHLAATGLDVRSAVTKGDLILSSERSHLNQGLFDPERMMHDLEEAMGQALRDGYSGLWATGDMTWELGGEDNFAKLLKYEWRLEEFFLTHPQLSGICQYHADTLPREVLRKGLLVHRAIFVNETLTRINPYHLFLESPVEEIPMNPGLEEMLDGLCQPAN